REECARRWWCTRPAAAMTRPGVLSRAGLYHPDMHGSLVGRLRSCLERPEIVALDPLRIGALARALDSQDPPATAGRWGTLIGFDTGAGRRRLVQFDRRGHLIAAFRWRDDGALAWAKCRTALGSWIGIEPGTGTHPGWGLSDRVWLLDAS